MKEQFHSFNFKANYFSLGNSDSPERIWIACHGYGQLASRFIKKFEVLDKTRNLVLVPEGLSHFYLEGLRGNVGASWMTKHNRLIEIENQFSFLESLFEKYSKINPNIRKTALGFSQGGATICRWLSNSRFEFDDIYLWATIFPPDLDTAFLNNTLKNKNVKIFHGNMDPFIKSEHLTMANNYLKDLPNMKLISYDGDHRVIPEVLLKNMD